MSAADTVFADLVGQQRAIEVVRAAIGDAHGDGSGAMTHAWLITGPPGSGRSNLAYAFATALLSPGGAVDSGTSAQVVARTHPDLAVLSTEGVVIRIEDVRALVQTASYSPSVSRFRVIVIEDADRMAERTSNVLLKALEEPPERTVWILCAPSEADLLPTIRSRVRSVRLTVPDPADVAELLVRRDGVSAELALEAARAAQSHIGMAHRLATDAGARDRRRETLELALGVRSVGDAVRAAARLVEIATTDAKAYTTMRDALEREHALRSLGVEEGGAVPPQLRSQLRAMEEQQKRRATRSLRDGIDRILTDLLSLHRDVLVQQLGADAVPVNALPGIAGAAAAGSSAHTLEIMDAIAVARRRIEANVTPLLSLEAMLISAVPRSRR